VRPDRALGPVWRAARRGHGTRGRGAGCGRGRAHRGREEAQGEGVCARRAQGEGRHASPQQPPTGPPVSSACRPCTTPGYSAHAQLAVPDATHAQGARGHAGPLAHVPHASPAAARLAALFHAQLSSATHMPPLALVPPSILPYPTGPRPPRSRYAPCSPHGPNYPHAPPRNAPPSHPNHFLYHSVILHFYIRITSTLHDATETRMYSSLAEYPPPPAPPYNILKIPSP
jgi:hypothetical protein